MADFWTALNHTPEEQTGTSKRRDRREVGAEGLGKRDFNGYVERDAAERFYDAASRLTGAFLSSVDSATYDPNEDPEMSIQERIARNTEQFVTALIAAVDSMDGDSTVENSTGDMTKRADTLLKSRTAVVDQVTELAKSSYPELAGRSIRAARAKIWKERPDLATRHAELPPEIPEAPAASEPVIKGADALAKIDAEATKLRASRPDLTERQARIEVTKLRPDLTNEYHKALVS